MDQDLLDIILQMFSRRVVGIKFSSSRTKIRKLKFVNYVIGDISKVRQLNKINEHYDFVVNLGGHVDHKNKTKTFNSHFIGTKNLAEFLKKQIFIQMGSSGNMANLSLRT